MHPFQIENFIEEQAPLSPIATQRALRLYAEQLKEAPSLSSTADIVETFSAHMKLICLDNNPTNYRLVAEFLIELCDEVYKEDHLTFFWLFILNELVVCFIAALLEADNLEQIGETKRRLYSARSDKLTPNDEGLRLFSNTISIAQQMEMIKTRHTEDKPIPLSLYTEADFLLAILAPWDKTFPNDYWSPYSYRLVSSFTPRFIRDLASLQYAQRMVKILGVSTEKELKSRIDTVIQNLSTHRNDLDWRIPNCGTRP